MVNEEVMKRVFELIPGLENAEFLRYGVMHTNNFVNFPKCLDKYSRLKTNPTRRSAHLRAPNIKSPESR